MQWDALEQHATKTRTVSGFRWVIGLSWDGLEWSFGARGGGRTRITLRLRDFKSLAYTSFATRACAHGAVATGQKEAVFGSEPRRGVNGQAAARIGCTFPRNFFRACHMS